MTIEEIKNKHEENIKYPYAVYDIFCDYFGEDNVDIQGIPVIDDNTDSLPDYSDIFILVHFPEVRITNEYDRYVDIKHLWAKIKVSVSGTIVGYFLLNRSEYQYSHYLSNYMHSHIADIPKFDHSIFKVPCLGNGPIKNTIASLSTSFNEELWYLFCRELEVYVTVESIFGIPYHRLENIKKEVSTVYNINNMESFYPTPNNLRDFISDFTKHLISSKVLSFSILNTSFNYGHSKVELIKIVSNEFIHWYNNYTKEKPTVGFLISKNVLWKGIFENSKFFRDSSIDIQKTIMDNPLMFYFKGKEVRLNLVDDIKSNNNNKIYILHPCLTNRLLCSILKITNFIYAK